MAVDDVEIRAQPDTDHSEAIDSAVAVQGGRERGLILHKLFEEVLTGETGDTRSALRERARTLVLSLGRTLGEDPMEGLSPDELAGCVVRTLALPEIEALRPDLVPEFGVFSSRIVDTTEEITVGIADAIGIRDGGVKVVVDWKSDVRCLPENVARYREQVRSYLRTTGCDRGLIVFVTSGEIIQVSVK